MILDQPGSASPDEAGWCPLNHDRRERGEHGRDEPRHPALVHRGQRPDGRDEHELTRALAEQDRVLVHPGWYFDLPGSHLVLSLVTTPGDFAAGVARVMARVTHA